MAETLRYSVPRNPDVPSPDLEELVYSGFAAQMPKDRDGKFEPIRLRASKDGKVPGERQSWHSTQGFMFLYNRGLQFAVIEAEHGSEAIAEIAGGLMEFAPDKLAAALVMIPAALLTAHLVKVLGERFPQSDSQRLREFKERFKKAVENPASFAVPYVDIIEASHHLCARSFLQTVASGWTYTPTVSSGKDQYELVSIAAESADGHKTAYIFEGDEWMPGRLLQHRMESEVSYMVRAMADPDSVAKDVLERYGDTLRQRTPDELQKDWKAAMDKRLKERGLDSLEGVYAAALQRLSPMLPHYRSVPWMAYELEIAEARARGWPDTWRPNWDPAVVKASTATEG